MSFDSLRRRLERAEKLHIEQSPPRVALWIIARSDADFAERKAEAFADGTYMPGQRVIWWRPISPQECVQ